MSKVYLAIYYLVISRLPNSRFISWFNYVRVFFVARFLKVFPLDKNTILENNVYLSDCVNVSIGRHCHINENVFIQGASIGNHVMIAPNVVLLNDMHGYHDCSMPMILQAMSEKSNPCICDDVWLGRNVIVMPGVTIGTGSIVGAMSVVTKDLPPYSVAVGVPARVIRSRLDDV